MWVFNGSEKDLRDFIKELIKNGFIKEADNMLENVISLETYNKKMEEDLLEREDLSDPEEEDFKYDTEDCLSKIEEIIDFFYKICKHENIQNRSK